MQRQTLNYYNKALRIAAAAAVDATISGTMQTSAENTCTGNRRDNGKSKVWNMT